MPEAIIFFFPLSQSFTDLNSSLSWLHQCTCTHRKFATMMIYSVFSLPLHKLFCDRRAYAYTRSRQWRASSNLVYVCPWESAWKNVCEYYRFHFLLYLCVLLSFIFFFFPKQLKEIGWCIVFSYSCRLGKKKTTETFIEEFLLYFVNSGRGWTYSFEQMKSKPTDEQPNWTPYE